MTEAQMIQSCLEMNGLNVGIDGDKWTIKSPKGSLEIQVESPSLADCDAIISNMKLTALSMV